MYKWIIDNNMDFRPAPSLSRNFFVPTPFSPFASPQPGRSVASIAVEITHRHRYVSLGKMSDPRLQVRIVEDS